MEMEERQKKATEKAIELLKYRFNKVSFSEHLGVTRSTFDKRIKGIYRWTKGEMLIIDTLLPDSYEGLNSQDLAHKIADTLIDRGIYNKRSLALQLGCDYMTVLRKLRKEYIWTPKEIEILKAIKKSEGI